MKRETFEKRAHDNQTLYLIKPDAFHKRDEIFEQIQKAGFESVSSIDTVLEEKVIRMLYGGNEDLLPFMIEYLAGRNVQVGVLTKHDAIKSFITLAGWFADPRKCRRNSLRHRYGNMKPLLRSGREHFYNAIHRTTQTDLQRELAIYWEELLHPRVIAAVKEIVSKHADCIERVKYHNDPVVANGIALAERYRANKSVVEIACYLHDVTRMSGDVVTHHITGGQVAEDLLRTFNYPSDKILLIRNCILNHRGSTGGERVSLEEKIVATADAMAHIQYPLPLFYKMFHNANMSMIEGRDTIIRKLARSWKKIHFPEVQDELRGRYQYLLEILKQENE